MTHSRAPLFADLEACTILGDKIRKCQAEWPFEVNAIVLLPEHLHAIWTLPAGDADYARRWAWIKKEFTKDWLASGGSEQPIARARERSCPLAALVNSSLDPGRCLRADADCSLPPSIHALSSAVESVRQSLAENAT